MYTHTNASDIEPIDDSRYCAPKCRFHNTHCQLCTGYHKFVEKKPNKDNGDIRPSSRVPIYVCKNGAMNCKFAICGKCYAKEFMFKVGRRNK